MRVREVVPDHGRDYDVTEAAGRAWLETVYAGDDARFVRLNMIASLTGAAVGADGTSDTLTSPTDRTILGIIRARADVVLVGAATVRAERYLLPRRARLAIVTATGELGSHRLHGAGDRVLLVAPEDRADAVRARADLPRAQLVPVPGGGDLDPHAIIDALAVRDLGRIVCEGGPTLAARFAAAGVIDEYCITVAPVLEAAGPAILPLAESIATDVAGMLVDEAAFSYLRLRPRQSGPDGAASR